MKKRFAVPFVCWIITILFLIGAVSLQVQADDKVIKLKYSNFFGPAHPIRHSRPGVVRGGGKADERQGKGHVLPGQHAYASYSDL